MPRATLRSLGLAGLTTTALAAGLVAPTTAPAGAVTGPGPHLVADLSPGRSGIEVDTGAVARLGNRLFFGAWTAETGTELFVTDGTATGTHVVRDVVPGTAGSQPQQLLAFGDRIYYAAQDESGDTELWTTDGTEAGTRRVLDIDPTASSRPRELISLGDRFLFVTSQDAVRGPELWTSQGTATTTKPLTATDLSSIDTPVRLGSTVVFAGTGDAGTEPYAVDPATGTVTLLRDIAPGSGGSLPYNLRQAAALGGSLYFAARSGDTQGTEVWRTNGTPAGTALVKDVYPGASSSNPNGFRVLGTTLYFAAQDGTSGQELWKSDGTAAGTVLVRDSAPGASSSSPQPGTALGSALTFIAFTEDTGWELWTSHGTAASTARVADIAPGRRRRTHAGSVPGSGSSCRSRWPAARAHRREPSRSSAPGPPSGQRDW